MTRELVLAISKIRERQPALTARGVAHVRIFGSVARGGAGPGSDVDVIIELAQPVRFTLFDLVATREVLERALQRRVDVMTAGAIRRSRFAKTAESEAITAF